MTPRIAAALREYRLMLAADGRALALDRGSARSYDSNGNMHVDRSHISRATVNEYTSEEINEAMRGKPGWTPLPAQRWYSLLRDPEALRKAAPTFQRLPILRKHSPISAAKFKPEEVIGTTGDNATFDGEYLDNSLTFWTDKAIGLIEDEERKELSASYFYDAVMTPGEYRGTHFDGRMTRIRGNHLALVEVGRAGHECAVGDEMPRHFTRPRHPGGGDTRRDTMPALTARRRARDDEPTQLTAEDVISVIDAMSAEMSEPERDRLDAGLRAALDRGMITGDKRQERRGAADSAISRLTFDRRPRRYNTGGPSFAEAFPAADRIKVS